MKTMSIQEFANYYYTLLESERDINEWVPVLEKLVGSIASKYTNIDLFKDVYQMGWITATKCINNYDISKGAPFSSYVSRALINEYNNYYRLKKKQQIDKNDMSKGYFGVVSLNATINDKDGKNTELINLIDGQEDEGYDEVLVMNILQSVIDNSSNAEKRVLNLRLEGLTHAEIAERLGTSRSYISRTLTKVKQKYLEN